MNISPVDSSTNTIILVGYLGGIVSRGYHVYDANGLSSALDSSHGGDCQYFLLTDSCKLNINNSLWHIHLYLLLTYKCICVTIVVRGYTYEWC